MVYGHRTYSMAGKKGERRRVGGGGGPLGLPKARSALGNPKQNLGGSGLELGQAPLTALGQAPP